MTPASWKIVLLTVSAGSQAITGLGGTPKALFFFGTNFTTYDAAVTSSGLGLFRGMAAPKWDAPGTILQNSACVITTPAGNAHHLANGHCINMLNTSGGLSFSHTAIVTSFDADGFTINFDGAAGAGQLVICAALMDVDNCGAHVGMYNGTTLALGWRPGAALLHGAWGSTDIGGSDRTQEFFGGAAYPTVRPPGTSYNAAGLTCFCFPTSSSAQYVLDVSSGQPPHIYIVSGGHFTGPFLTTSNIVVYPTGVGETSLVFGGDAEDGGMVVVWDDDENWCEYRTPAAGVGGVVSQALLFDPGLLIGYTISNEPPIQGTGGRGAAGMSVVTPDFQWCATIDGHSSQGAFQSFNRGFCSAISGTSYHAGTVELLPGGFELTTTEAGIAQGTMSWHSFGHPKKSIWLPPMNRYAIS